MSVSICTSVLVKQGSIWTFYYERKETEHQHCAQRPSRYTVCHQRGKTVNAGRRKMEVVGSQQQLEHSSSGNGRTGGKELRPEYNTGIKQRLS